MLNLSHSKLSMNGQSGDPPKIVALVLSFRFFLSEEQYFSQEFLDFPSMWQEAEAALEAQRRELKEAKISS